MKPIRPWMQYVSAAALAFLLLASPPASAREMPGSFADLVQKLTPAVVNISTTQKVKPRHAVPGMPELPPGTGMEEFRDFFERFTGPQDEGRGREAYSLGSGFIIDSSGYVVTNNHVISDAEEIKVILSDDTKLSAKVIGRDSKTDLALLKVEAKKPLPFVSLGDSDSARVGDWVICVGNPFGLGGTVTAGIISARARNINSGPFDDFIQTDAAINRGNSGGPMFNVAGEVIGINSAIFSPSGGNIGIGFAVPSTLAKPIIEQLKQYGRTHRGWLGVKIQEVNEEIAESVGLGEPQGAMVLEVNKDGPAEKAGVQAGDVILSFDGRAIKTMRSLPRIVAETKIGKTVEVTVWRGGEKKAVSITLGELNEKDEEVSEKGEGGESPQQGNVKVETVAGMDVAPVGQLLRERFNLNEKAQGLVVVDINAGSEAAKRGIHPGDVIVQVGESPVATAAELKKTLAAIAKQGRKSALTRIQRGGEILFVTLPAERE